MTSHPGFISRWIAPLVLGIAMAPTAFAADAFDQLQAIAGSWRSTSGTLEVEYRVLSRGSALVETYGVGHAGATLSVYHADGDSLLMTHYCAQGNQPRLALQAQPDAGTFAFAFRDASHAGETLGSHLVELRLALDGDALVRTEVYAAPDGTRETTTLALQRVAPAPR
jgi:hypothetical protein